VVRKQRSAKTLALVIPPGMLARSDEVIG